MYPVPADQQEFHLKFANSVRWRLTADGIEVEGSGVERTPGQPSTATRIWEANNAAINQYASAYTVPAELIMATICTETAGNAAAVREEPGYVSDEQTPNKVSPGIMQTLISTARSTLAGRGVAEATVTRAWLLIAENSINAGTSYIADQKSSTNFDPVLVAAAYNAGGLYEQTGASNRFKLRQYPIGSSEHCDRFIKWFNDFWEVLRTHTTRPTVSFFDSFKPCVFPANLGAGNAVNPANVEKYYEHTEKTHKGGYFPLGTNTVWHGGLHLHMKRGSKVVSALSGELVAARLAAKEETAYGYYGSRNFMLLKHRVTPSIAETLLPDTVVKYKVTSNTLNVRQTIGHKNKPAEDVLVKLSQNDECTPTNEAVENADDLSWAAVTVSKAANAAHQGTTGYIAIGDKYVEATHDEENQQGREELKDAEYFSLYMHLNNEALDTGNENLATIPWLSATRKKLSANRNMREQPGTSPPATLLSANDEFEVLDDDAGNADGYTWMRIRVTKASDASLVGREGYMAHDAGKMTDTTVVDEAQLKQFESGDVVKLENKNLAAGDQLWTTGEYGSKDYRTGLIHWEIFSGDNLFGHGRIKSDWPEATDTDEDYNMDTKEILDLVDQDWWGRDDLLTAEEVVNFYLSDPDAPKLRKYACKFVIEWGINLDLAIPQMKGRWYTGHLKKRITPYLWWNDANAKKVPLPESTKVWHYNPIAVLEAFAPSEAAAPADNGPASTDDNVIIERTGTSVPHYCQGSDPWGDRLLGNSATVQGKGCAISSIAMVLAYYDRDIDPGSLDEHLDNNNGYVGDNVVWATAFQAGQVDGGAAITLTNHNDRNSSGFAETLNDRIDQNIPTIAEVDYDDDAGLGGDHFVVIVGRTANGELIINDPGSSAGDGAGNPSDDNIIEKTSRHTGMTIVRLVLFDVSGA